MATKESSRRIDIDTAPSAADIRHIWAQIETDPLRPMLLADTTTFLSSRHFLAAVGNTILPFVAFVDGDPVALAWLYNIAMAPPKMTALSAWLAFYALAQFRGSQIWLQGKDAFLASVRTYGLEHLWAEVRLDNLASQYVLRVSGFTHVATVPSWKRYQGQWHDMQLYHLPLAPIVDLPP